MKNSHSHPKKVELPMTESDSSTSNSFKPLRVWIPILLLPLMVLARFIPDLIPDGPAMT